MDEVEDYLTRYADSLTGFDAARAAELWAVPGMIVDDRFAGVLDDRDAMAAGLEQSYPVYRKLGLSSVTHETLKIEKLTDAILLVRVRWRFHDSDGKQLTDSTAFYILRRDDTGTTRASASRSTTPRRSKRLPPSAASTSRHLQRPSCIARRARTC